ncbi:hypothetical protein SAY87_004867 [Trapa incisa]|uniref:Uncharacterized protein n=1 Tax=Trapa incisa TaxID=236973 RepID=A0AAN7PTK1_9MYRT|nr:hypothetical protein SAY87_004867 [Trapa incisa]
MEKPLSFSDLNRGLGFFIVPVRTGTKLGMALVKMDVGEEETGGGSQPPPFPTNF